MKRALMLIGLSWGLAGAQPTTPLTCNGLSGTSLQTCRTQIAQENARRLRLGLPPLSATPTDPGNAARQKLSAALAQPVPAAPQLQTSAQKAQAAQNPALAAQWAKRSQDALNDSSTLKELSAAQVLGMIRAAQEDVTVISALPDQTSLNALNTAVQKAKVTLIVPTGTRVSGLSGKVTVRQLPVSQNGQVQGVIMIDRRILILGNLSEKGRYSGTNNPGVAYSMHENLQQLLKRAFP